jgi:hypothetical protein
MNQNQFEVVGTFHLSKLNEKYPSFILKDVFGKEKQFYVSEKSKPYAEKIQPGEGVKVTFDFNSRPKGEYWNTYANAFKVEELGYVPTAE